MRGILLAGGNGSRLDPLTRAVSKHLLPVYDTPMIYFPLVTLMQARIREILLISSPRFLSAYRTLLGDGRQWGISISYACQKRPQGIAEAFLIGANFIKNHRSCLALGDNLIICPPEIPRPIDPSRFERGAIVHAKCVPDPKEYAVLRVDSLGRPIDIVEKPVCAASRWALIGFYFYDEQVVEIARSLKPSSRGELEITDINNHYLRQGQLHVRKLTRRHTWFDAGSPNRLIDASSHVRRIQQRCGQQIACPVTLARHNSWISADDVEAEALRSPSPAYRQHLRRLLDRDGAPNLPLRAAQLGPVAGSVS